MDPILLSLIALLGSLTYIGVSIIRILTLCFKQITEIFLRFGKSVRITRKDVMFISQEVNSDKCTHIYGIFDTCTGKVKAHELIRAEKVDSAVQQHLNETGTILLT
jgi:hypothetical protein